MPSTPLFSNEGGTNYTRSVRRTLTILLSETISCLLDWQVLSLPAEEPPEIAGQGKREGSAAIRHHPCHPRTPAEERHTTILDPHVGIPNDARWDLNDVDSSRFCF
jgi:hypothetical protein